MVTRMKLLVAVHTVEVEVKLLLAARKGTKEGMKDKPG
jgi:hypothetical protein